MKLGTSLLLASLTSIVAVACTAEPAPAAKDKSEANEEQVQAAPKTEPAASKDPKATPSKPGTTTTPTTTTKPATETSSALAVCKACLSKSTKGAELVKCVDKCGEKDAACHSKCQDDVCGLDGAKCDADLAKCDAECKPAEPTPEENAAFDKCMAENPKTKALHECEKKCTDDTTCEKCWTDSQCETDEACTKQLDKCEGAGG